TSAAFGSVIRCQMVLNSIVKNWLSTRVKDTKRHWNSSRGKGVHTFVNSQVERLVVYPHHSGLIVLLRSRDENLPSGFQLFDRLLCAGPSLLEFLYEQPMCGLQAP